MLAGPKVGERWEKVGKWTQGEKRGRVGGVLSAPLPVRQLIVRDVSVGYHGIRLRSLGYLRRVFDALNVLAAEKTRFPMATLPETLMSKAKFSMTVSQEDVEAAVRLLAEVVPEWCCIKPAAFSGGMLFHIDRRTNINDVRRKVAGLAASAGGEGPSACRRATLGAAL
eukprot:1177027-Prorocentrum_minimum.AAC.2